MNTCRTVDVIGPKLNDYIRQTYATSKLEGYCKSLIFSEFSVFDLSAKLKER